MFKYHGVNMNKSRVVMGEIVLPKNSCGKVPTPGTSERGHS